MPRKNLKDFVIFDVETTGLSHRYGDRMIEIGALKVSIPMVGTPDGAGLAFDLRGMEKCGSFCSLLNVPREISYGAFMVNGITPQMLKGAPPPEKVLPGFLEFIEGAYLIGHNVRFDLGFLANELALLGLALSGTKFLDTVRLARRLLPELRRHSLGHVAHFLGVERMQEHRAMSDVEITYEVFRSLLAIADRRDCCSLEELVRLCGGEIPC